MFCRPTNGFSCNDFCCCCSLAVWTNSTLWSTTTPTQTSTWWKTWAAWTGWVSPCPVSDYLSQPTVLKGPGIEPPEDSSPQQFPKHKMPLSVCQRRGAVSRNMVIRRLETFPAGLDLFFSLPMLSISLCRLSFPPSLHWSVATLLHHYPSETQGWAVGENHSLFSESVSLGLCNCSQTNRSRTVTESQHGSVFPQLSSFSLHRIRSAPPFSPLHTSSIIFLYIFTIWL